MKGIFKGTLAHISYQNLKPLYILGMTNGYHVGEQERLNTTMSLKTRLSTFVTRANGDSKTL